MTLIPEVPARIIVSRRLARTGRRFALAGHFRSILINVATAVASTVLTSGLGFLYWWLAARAYPALTVGRASALASVILLIGWVGTLGLGTILLGVLPVPAAGRGARFVASLTVSAVAGFTLGAGFVVLAPLLGGEFLPLRSDPILAGLLITGSGLTALAMVLDQGLLALRRGDLQLWRNGVFAVAKLAALGLFALVATDHVETSILASWIIGLAISLLAAAALGRVLTPWVRRYPIDWDWLRGSARVAVAHQLVNLAFNAPPLSLPILVTALTSATTNAYFFVAWLIATLFFSGPGYLAIMMYSSASANPGRLAETLRFTLAASLAGSFAANALVQPFAELILGVFGPTYAEQSSLALRVFTLGMFPLIIKDHFVAIRRVEGRLIPVAGVVAAGGVLELIAAGVGAVVAGIPGVAIGWLAALVIQAALMAPAVARSTRIPARTGGVSGDVSQ